MSPQAEQIFQIALRLSPIERAELIEKLFDAFSSPERESIDARWAIEVEDRIEAYERGEIQSKPATEVFARIERGGL